MTPSLSAITLLADMKALGIDVQPLGDAIRYRPRHAMTPALLERLQTHKTELLHVLDTAAAITALRHSVELLWKVPAWGSAWEQRFKAAQYADFASLRRVLNIVIDLAEGHHRRHDWKAFDSARKYLHRLASGEEWDRVAPIQDDDRWEIKT